VGEGNRQYSPKGSLKTFPAISVLLFVSLVTRGKPDNVPFVQESGMPIAA
jgi:hypothetical protein